MEGRRRSAPGRRDHVPQLRGVHPRLSREHRRALEGLDHEVVGDVAREAEVDGGVDQRLHDEEDVGRAGPADRGRHRHHLLVVDLELMAEGAEQRRRLRSLRLCRLGRGVPDRHALPQAGRGVGHAAHDLIVAEDPSQCGSRGAGEHAQHELPATQVRADLAPDPFQHLGLDPQQDDVGVTDGVGVGADGRDPVLALQRFAPFRARVTGDDAPGPTRPSRSRPAIIASAITPEPTVAIVAFDRGDTAGV